MRNKLHRLYVLFFTLLAGGVFLLAVIFGLMQTKTFKNYIVETLVEEAKKNNIELEIEGLHGLAPFKWSLDNAKIIWPDGQELSLEKVKLRIALFSLFKKQLSISFLSVDKMQFSFNSFEENKDKYEVISSFSLPFHFSARTVKIKELLLKNLSTNQSLNLKLSGKAKIRKDLKELQVDLLISEPAYENKIDIQIISSKKNEIINASAKVTLNDSKNLALFFQIPVETSLDFSFLCQGKWSFWKELERRSLGSPLLFNIDVKTKNLHVANLSFLNRDWSLKTDLSLWPDLSSSCENCFIESNWLRLLGKANFSSSLTPISCSAVVSISELAELNSILPYEVHGRLEAKAGLRDKAFLVLATSTDLSIGKQLFQPALFKIEGSLKNEEWEGLAFCDLKNNLLPWKGSLEFDFEKNKIQIKNIDLEAGEAKISGEGALNLQEDLFQGSFFILAPELRPFRSLFEDSDLDGRLGGRFSVLKKEKQLDVSANLLFKNVRYQSSLIDSARIEAELSNILIEPSGSFSLECENLLVKGGEIAKLQFSSTSTKEEKQAFSLEVQGNWKQEFSLLSTGFWKKKEDNWWIQFQECQGYLFTQPFAVAPFKLGQDNKTLFIKDCSLKVAEGTLFLDCQLGKDTALIKTNATHLPLDVFSLFYPSITLEGQASFQGSFLGSKDSTEGSFFATLEEIDFLQTNKLNPMKAKASLQIHFNPLTAQIHSHFYATQNQFLDWTATLPVNYSYHPFKVKLDPLRSLSSELTMQGAIEDILSFLQTASQKASGWVTSHLFLSGSFDSPSIQGSIGVQNGSYENYSSGTALQNIEIDLSAVGSSVTLNSFTATDKKQGSAKATGELALQNAQHFPFHLNGTLTHLNLIESDTLSATATGEVVITGDLYSAKTVGDLTADSTTFTISDNIQMEIPSLPITYINKPIHLQRSNTALPSTYPFKLELSITANDTAFIKGKGLDSEWYGKVLLTGTPSSPIGKGSLSLKQGEFKFSGKTFTLMQGELAFTDKPGQDAYLKLSGQFQISGTNIIANLQGPLTSPRLTFQSTPYLPTSAILSLILFNKDISEISALQAIQLAQVIMSLSGNGGPDVLEAIRKSIGVDKLNIAGKDGTDEIALQIGWYITHGITVSLSQSTTSSDITIEVDLKHGFIFEAETQNQEEGKFSLKWNRNY